MSLFSSVQLRKPKRNMIPLSFSNLLTTSFGKLTPCLVEECLPGDVFRVRTEVFTRFQPLMAPIMDRCNISLHYFFVPSRILFKDFYSFLTGEDDEAVIPFAKLNNIYEACYSVGTADSNRTINGTVFDYLNIPSTVASSGNPVPTHLVNMLPLLAYWRIWFDYYRDENLSEATEIERILDNYLISGGMIDSRDLEHLCMLANRAFKKDYFTAALPWPQKGDDVLIPLEDSPVHYKRNSAIQGPTAEDFEAQYLNNGPQRDTDVFVSRTSGVAGQMYADNRSLAPTINDLRKSFRIQELLERNARGGTRPQEFIRAHWGVNAKDARLQRPEYIGGSTTPIQISEVLSQSVGTLTEAGDANSNLGRLGGHGISAGVADTKKYRVTEHGYLMCILSVMPQASYYQGLPRMYSHLDRYDFFFPSLANIGEQEVLNKEVYVDSSDEVSNDSTFGYVPRYAEYKVHQNEIHGDFRSSLYYWHLARSFSHIPGLNQEFIECEGRKDGLNRIFTSTDGKADKILIQLYHHNKPVRLMPYFGNPKF